MTEPSNWEEEDDEWEVINDDGFVYKRKKRPRLDPSAPSSSFTVPPDQELERKNRVKQKKITLLKIKERYEREILQWEHLSNTFSSIQLKTSSIPPQQEPPQIHGAIASSSQSTDSNRRRIIDEFLLQAEAQEAIIEDTVKICEIAEAICREKEEQMKLSFTELPVWSSSPHQLIMSMCDD